jgi:hypothetical protein
MAASSSTQQVEALELRYSVRLPDDFKAYLLAGAPAEYLWDHDCNWWPVQRIKNIPDEYEHSIGDAAIAAEANAYLFFADYLVWSWAWAICCSDGPNRGKVAIIDGVQDRFVADSFSDFAARCVRDPHSLF